MLHRRHGDDPAQEKAVLDALASVRERVLRNASIAEGETLLDVGAGDGLIAFGALQKVGEQGAVIFSDISQDLLDHCRQLAQQFGVIDSCRFLRAPAHDLSALGDGTVDVVTTRSVLIYVKEKQRAFEEFHRVLRPDGRMSLFEPINRFAFPEPPHLFAGYDMTPVLELAHKVRAVYERLQPLTDPMLDFDERDLLNLAERAGFEEVHLELEVSVVPAEKRQWEASKRTSGNPLIPTLQEAIEQALTPTEAERFEAYMKGVVEAGAGKKRAAVAYLWGRKEQD